MPRGVPNIKREDAPLRFTLFNIPPQLNQKQIGSHYLKSEEQTLWGRGRKQAKNTEASAPQEGRRGSNIIVIHPGSRFLRIGRASDVFPVAVPHVIARKSKVPMPPPVHVTFIAGNTKKKRTETHSYGEENAMDVDGPQEPWDPIDPRTSPIASSLRDRMVFYKLQVAPRATELCSAFNDQAKAEIIPDHNDPYRIEWTDGESTDDIFVGEKALRLANPHRMGYTVRWPFRGSRFNALDYGRAGPQALLNDIEAIWSSVLRKMLKIPSETFKDFSVILIVPDLFERYYVRELVNILLVQMGFKQACVQQESLSATFGAGISNACVIDAGAAKTSIAIVDEGLVLPESRISLNMGGDDITEFLLALLERINFPYRDIDLSHSYDWNLIEELKGKLCTLAEADVAMNMNDVVVRRPGKPTVKYVFRAYNESILAPMCLFEPRVIDFEHKLVYMRPLWDPEVVDDVVEQADEQITQAMKISTQHLFPPAIVPPIAPPAPAPAPTPTPAPAPAPVPGAFTAAPVPSTSSIEPPAPSDPVEPTAEAGRRPVYGRPMFTVAPQMAQAPEGGPPPQIGSFTGRTESRFISLDASDFEATSWTAKEGAPPLKEGGGEPQQMGETPTDGANKVAPSVVPPGGYSTGGLGIDVTFEAGKLPLDVAIFNSARAVGGDDKIRKYLQAVLVVGGSALVPGMAHALESRLQAIATPLVADMDKVQIIAPPRDVDPRVLCWKGGSVLGKMDAVGDLWVNKHDWEILGMRALKERCFFL